MNYSAGGDTYSQTAFDALVAARDAGVMETLIRRCAILHLEHIRTSGDPFEYGSARPLDFGHWAAHKIETLSNYAVGHGQAVAVGIAIDAHDAMVEGLLTSAQLDRICSAMIANPTEKLARADK